MKCTLNTNTQLTFYKLLYKSVSTGNLDFESLMKKIEPLVDDDTFSQYILLFSEFMAKLVSLNPHLDTKLRKAGIKTSSYLDQAFEIRETEGYAENYLKEQLKIYKPVEQDETVKFFEEEYINVDNPNLDDILSFYPNLVSVNPDKYGLELSTLHHYMNYGKGLVQFIKDRKAGELLTRQQLEADHFKAKEGFTPSPQKEILALKGVVKNKVVEIEYLKNGTKKTISKLRHFSYEYFSTGYNSQGKVGKSLFVTGYDANNKFIKEPITDVRIVSVTKQEGKVEGLSKSLLKSLGVKAEEGYSYFFKAKSGKLSLPGNVKETYLRLTKELKIGELLVAVKTDEVNLQVKTNNVTIQDKSFQTPTGHVFVRESEVQSPQGHLFKDNVVAKSVIYNRKSDVKESNQTSSVEKDKDSTSVIFDKVTGEVVEKPTKENRKTSYINDIASYEDLPKLLKGRVYKWVKIVKGQPDTIYYVKKLEFGPSIVWNESVQNFEEVIVPFSELEAVIPDAGLRPLLGVSKEIEDTNLDRFIKQNRLGVLKSEILSYLHETGVVTVEC